MSLSDSLTETHELTVSRLIDAPRPLVFRAWTDPEQVARWWGPAGFVIVDYAMDIRPGGAYRLSMRSPEGTVHRKRGVYREIVAPERIVFSFAWVEADGRLGLETLVTVTFEAVGGKTRLILRQTGFDAMPWRDSHVAGWTSTLARFNDFMATV